MIFIQLDEKQIPREWLDKAADLTEQLQALSNADERAAFIKRHAGFWKEIKTELLNMSYGKCWYTEAKDVVSDYHVDHFRPKARARDLDENEYEGYAWLAFDWRNYRICGSFPNSAHTDQFGDVRGKRDYFPLLPDCQRACWDSQDCTCERPLLLDPTVPGDPSLIAFDEEGTLKPFRPDSPIVSRRVNETVRIMYLDAPQIVEARRATWRHCRDLIERMEALLDVDYEKSDAEREHAMTKVAKIVVGMAAPDQPFSAVARACIRAHGFATLLDQWDKVRAA